VRQQSRPGEKAAGAENSITSNLPLPNDDERHVDRALRFTWLRVHAERLYSVDPCGYLSAQLRDFTDLLEVAQCQR